MPIILPPPAPPTPPADTGPVTTSGSRLYDRLAPISIYDEANGNILQAIAETLAEHQSLIEQIVLGDATFEPWERATSPDETPVEALAWLAQFPGVQLQPADTEAQQRARIKAAAGFYRGTPRAIIEAIQLALDPATPRTVMIVERDDGAMWSYTVGTRSTETPDPAAVAQANAAQKPAGMLTSTHVIGSLTLLEFEAAIVAHRETIDGIDTYVPDSAGGTLSDFEAISGTLGTWEAGP